MVDYTEKAGVGGSTPSRGTNYFASTEPTKQIPFPLSKIAATRVPLGMKQAFSFHIGNIIARAATITDLDQC
jgi:hypothetical protein